MNSIIDNYIQKGLFDGVSILAGNSSETLFAHTRGLANRNTGRPMTQDTVFDISSISKPLGTATLILLLAEEGRLSLDHCFKEYLPEFTGSMPRPVDLRMLAAHCSGIEPDYPLGVSAAELTARMLNSNFTSAPWTVYRYCCVNYHFLGFILENISGRPLQDLAQEKLFGPLGMNKTRWGCCHDNQRSRLVIHQRCTDSDPGIIFDRWARILFPRAVGNAGIFTEITDLAIYAKMILRKGAGLFHSDIVEKEMMRKCTPPELTPRSFGWNMDPDGRINSFSERTIYHSGSSGQTLWIDPEQDRFMIVMSNLFGDHDAAIKARKHIAELAAARIWN